MRPLCRRSSRALLARRFDVYGLPAKFTTRRVPAERTELWCQFVIQEQGWRLVHRAYRRSPTNGRELYPAIPEAR